MDREKIFQIRLMLTIISLELFLNGLNICEAYWVDVNLHSREMNFLGNKDIIKFFKGCYKISFVQEIEILEKLDF